MRTHHLSRSLGLLFVVVSLSSVIACGGAASEDDVDVDVSNEGSQPSWSPSMLRLPNLRIVSGAFRTAGGTPTSACSGQVALIKVRNDGNAPAAASTLYFANQTAPVPALAAGTEAIVVVTYQWVPNVIASVDINNVVFESNENDNSMTFCIG